MPAQNANDQENHKGHLWQVEIANTQTPNDKSVKVSKIFNMSSYRISDLSMYVGNYLALFQELNPEQGDGSGCDGTRAPSGG